MPLQAGSVVRAKDVMVAKPIAINASATPRELARILLEHEISGVPVVDRNDRVIGVVSKTDLLQWCAKGGLGFGADNLLSSLADGGSGTRLEAVDLGIVEDFMSSRPLTASADEPLNELAQRMVRHQVHRLVVVDDDGCLQGIITSMDLLRVFPCSACK